MTTAAICATRELSWTSSFYRGEQYDSDLGLYYLRARYYNPATGRFLSRDPLDPQPFGPDGYPINPSSLHKYLYAGGDPINASDPTGRDYVEYKLVKGEMGAAALTALPIVANVVCGEFAVVSFVLDGMHYFNPKSPALPWPVKAPCAAWGIWKAAYAAYAALVAAF